MIGALAAYFNVLLIPLIVLLVVMLIDYITGMAGAAYSGKPLLYDYLNKGQRKKIVNTAEVKALFDRYGVEYEE